MFLSFRSIVGAMADRATLPGRYGALLGASLLLGQSLTYSNGTYSTNALLCVVIALLIVAALFVAALRGERSLGPEWDSEWTLGFVWIALFGLAFSAWNQKAILAGPHTHWAFGPVAHVGSLVLLLTYLPWLPRQVGSARIRRVGRYLRFGLFGALVVVAGADAIRALAQPPVDVWTVQTAGAKALLEGLNPYEVVRMQDSGPRPGAFDVPYVYAPAHLLVTIPALLVAGDVRYAMLVAVLVAGVAMRVLAHDERLPALAQDAPALAFWLAPKLYLILEVGWTDPVSLMWIAVAVAAYVARRPTATALLVGAALASKQSMFWLAPIAGWLLGFSSRQWLLMFGVAAATVVPFAAWNPKALLHANFGFLSSLPHRADGLTITNWARMKLGFGWPPAVAFLLAAGVVFLSARRLPRGAASFTLAATLAFFVTFAFNKWAFANYYLFLTGLAAVAAAAVIGEQRRA
jgi:hypothetical protein